MGGFFVPTIHFYLQELPFDRTACELHTLIHTFAILNYPPHIVPDLIPAKCELRDVIHILPSFS
jgi:hypothetical protein